MKPIIYIIISSMVSCSSLTAQNTKDKTKHYTDKEIVKDLKRVTNFPDDYFFPKGDSICQKILSHGKSITPLLINEIDNTSNSDYIEAGVIRYKVGDIAINLIDYLYNNTELPIKKLLSDEFFSEDTNDYQYVVLYNKVFFYNSKKKNLQNRIRFKEVIKKWYYKSINK